MRKLRWIGLLAVLFVTGPLPGRSEEGTMSFRLVLTCNQDGTWTCGDNCMAPPYNGRWCCER